MYQQRQQPKHGFEKYDKILYGAGIGILVPFVGLAFLMLINENIAALELQTQSGVFDGLWII